MLSIYPQYVKYAEDVPADDIAAALFEVEAMLADEVSRKDGFQAAIEVPLRERIVYGLIPQFKVCTAVDACDIIMSVHHAVYDSISKAFYHLLTSLCII